MFKWKSILICCAITCVTNLYLIPAAHAQSRTVRIIIHDHGFSPGQVLGQLHQPVHLEVVNEGKQVHEFAIPEYRIYSRDLGPGEKTEIEFAPWQAGSFVMYSDPSADENPEFAGRFIVSN